MTDISIELIHDLNRQLDLELKENLGDEALESLLADWVEQAIRRDFQFLVQFLYRIDVSEVRLRRLLEENRGENTGRVIARLILERQRQKVETRQKYRQEGPYRNSPGNELPEDPDLERL